jgi:hypothetical protein
MNFRLSSPRFWWLHSRTVWLAVVLALALVSGCSRGRVVEQALDQSLADKLETVLHRLDGSGAIVSARF